MSNETQQHILRAMAANYDDGQYWDHLDSEVCVKAADEIAALEAQCAKLRGPEETVTSAKGDKLFTFMSKDPCRYQLCEVTYAAPVRVLIAERDALRTKLEAIRAAGGEVVEVVAWRVSHPDAQWKVYEQQPTWAASYPALEVQDLMTVAQHQRIVAAMAAELEMARKDAGADMFLTLSGELARTRKELEAARKQEPDSDAELATRMKAAGMMSVAELLAGAPLDAFTRHAAVNDLQSLLQWAEMRRAECLKAQARYDLGERDKSDDLYEWTVAHCAVFTELHVNIRAALAGLPPLAGQVSVPRELLQTIEQSWRVPNGWPKSVPEHVTEKIESGLRELRALLATPSMEVGS